MSLKTNLPSSTIVQSNFDMDYLFFSDTWATYFVFRKNEIQKKTSKNSELNYI